MTAMTHTLTDPDCPQSVRDQINGGVTQEAREIAEAAFLARHGEWPARTKRILAGECDSEVEVQIAHRALTPNQARCEQLEADNTSLQSDIDELMRRIGPRWFLEQGWFPDSQQEERRNARAALPSTGASRG